MFVTRFAPSPTGFLHLGGLRTALFSYVLARSRRGKFILRIEDTDSKRTVPGAAENLASILNIFGLTYDEGPFIQSQRASIYRQHAEKLLDNDAAYRCFCSANTSADTAVKKSGGYDRRCRHISVTTITENLQKNLPYSIRLKIPEGRTSFVDLIHAKLEFANRALDDSILLKSDGLPTYHLANVVDDKLMGVTHILRGEEWIPSTPKHVLLYRAFGWEDSMPKFAHVPLLINKNGQKLSKRHSDVNEKGYLPEALLNFVGMLGFTPPISKEIWLLDDFIEHFNVCHLSKSAAIVSYDQLDRLNRLHIAHRLKSDSPLRENLVDSIRRDFLSQYNSRIQESIREIIFQNSHFIAVLLSVLPRITFIHQFPSLIASVYCLPDFSTQESSILKQTVMSAISPATSFTEISESNNSVVSCLEAVPETQWTEENLKTKLKEFAKTITERRIKYGGLMKFLRFAVTGDKTGDDLTHLMVLLGKNAVIERINICNRNW
ncbi:Glutamyl-tRNA synthetase [Physocladia obscura]|uniref:glutamate--tRNA ligase n=1 Tax=Physocladia obscura TaxID=109957 RepID=A0AAD5T7U4_9FUNG|nr:Glutamyl-tRNA synthetase [Physocladia obscura]